MKCNHTEKITFFFLLRGQNCLPLFRPLLILLFCGDTNSKGSHLILVSFKMKKLLSMTFLLFLDVSKRKGNVNN